MQLPGSVGARVRMQLCFKDYVTLRETLNAMAAGIAGIERVRYGHGVECIDMRDGSSILFRVATNAHTRGIHCTCGVI